MSANCKKILDILRRDGTERASSLNASLDPDHLNLHDLGTSDWILFAINFSKHISYFSTKSAEEATGNWEAFFKTFDPKGLLKADSSAYDLDSLRENINETLSQIEFQGTLSPHLTLFVSFLNLLTKSQESFNGLTKRHLDFYYQQVLQIEKEALVPDKVYVIFELAKGLSSGLIPQGTLLDAGKDPIGQKLSYKTSTESSVNTAQIEAIQSLYHDIKVINSEIDFHDSSLDSGTVVIAPMANSFDGQGADFPTGEQKWWPFGYTDQCNASTLRPALPTAPVGFAIASSLLQMAEGTRLIDLTFTFDTAYYPQKIDTSQLNDALSLEITSPKGWLLSPDISLSIEPEEDEDPKVFNIKAILSPEAAAISNYEVKVHGKNYATVLPILKVNLDTAIPEGYKLFRLLSNPKLVKIDISTTVLDGSSLIIESDIAKLNPKKPFLPFGPRPLRGSSFSLYSPEAATKPVKQITFAMDFLNLPEDLVAHYIAYKDKDGNAEIDSLDYFGVKIVQASVSKSQNLFGAEEEPNEFAIELESNSNLWNKPADAKVKVSLSNSFLHEKYPHYYTLATLVNQESITLEQIPNEPYTPIAENIKYSYTASQTIYSENLGLEPQFGFFHDYPYGNISISHESEFITLFPQISKGGSLYIGLRDAGELQQVPILFQLAEGSENPTLEDIFEGDEKIKWSYLVNDRWVDFPPGSITKNQSPRFLKTGIITFTIPKEASSLHSLMPAGVKWLRASMDKAYDVVSQFLQINTQAVEAEYYQDQEILGAHLPEGIKPKTISKLQKRLSWVKKIEQPFASFDGQIQSDELYYQGISERLRHKNRAVTSWDYEHLILHKFKAIYKVKCLNHSCDSSFQSPGNITIVLVPDTIRQSVYDIYQPRVSQGMLNQVSTYVNSLNSFQIQAKVINPRYHEVQIRLKVKFREGLDFSIYKSILNDAIRAYLSPWAFDRELTVSFGIALHRSQLIHHLEKLGYVDYLEDVMLLQAAAGSSPCESVFEESPNQVYIRPEHPAAILVSAKSHQISASTTACETIQAQTIEEC